MILSEFLVDYVLKTGTVTFFGEYILSPHSSIFHPISIIKYHFRKALIDPFQLIPHMPIFCEKKYMGRLVFRGIGGTEYCYLGQGHERFGF